MSLICFLRLAELFGRNPQVLEDDGETRLSSDDHHGANAALHGLRLSVWQCMLHRAFKTGGCLLMVATIDEVADGGTEGGVDGLTHAQRAEARFADDKGVPVVTITVSATSRAEEIEAALSLKGERRKLRNDLVNRSGKRPTALELMGTISQHEATISQHEVCDLTLTLCHPHPKSLVMGVLSAVLKPHIIPVHLSKTRREWPPSRRSYVYCVWPLQADDRPMIYSSCYICVGK